MQMSDFIRSNLEQILSDWEEFAATLLPAAAGLDAEVLRDFAAEMLGRVAEDMEVGQTRAQQLQKSRGEHPDRSPHVTTAAQEHAAHRLRDTFTQEQLVAEFRALRASVIRRWADQLAEVGPPALEELTRFNESVDQLLTESLSWYDRELQETRRQADEARRQREESYRALAELKPDATMVYAGKRIVYANGAAARRRGCSAPILRTRSWADRPWRLPIPSITSMSASAFSWRFPGRPPPWSSTSGGAWMAPTWRWRSPKHRFPGMEIPQSR